MDHFNIQPCGLVIEVEVRINQISLIGGLFFFYEAVPQPEYTIFQLETHIGLGGKYIGFSKMIAFNQVVGNADA